MKTNFKKQLWISGIIIGGTILIASFGFYYFSGSLSAAVARVVRNRAAEQAQASSLGKLAELQQDAPAAANYETAINDLIPSEYALINFNEWLGTLGNTFSVTASAELQGTPATPAAGSIGQAPFNLTADGTFANIVAFVQSLESKAPAYLLSLSSFEITSDSGGNAHLTAQGVLFFQQ